MNLKVSMVHKTAAAAAEILLMVGSVLVPLNSIVIFFCGRRSGLMVSALVSRASSLGSSPGWGHCVVFLGKTLYSHGAPLHPGI